MTRRERIGSRRHRAKFEQHDGGVDEHGNPTYTSDNDWDAVVTSWPCELKAVTEGEQLRGKQVSADTTHVLFGEYGGARDVETDMRAVVTSTTTGLTTTYEIVSVLDLDGEGRELRIELKREH